MRDGQQEVEHIVQDIQQDLQDVQCIVQDVCHGSEPVIMVKKPYMMNGESQQFLKSIFEDI